MFTLSPHLDTVGITGMGELEVSPSEIVRRFGAPGRGDDFKVSGEFVFSDAQGRAFVVHDWKATNLWDPSFPSPAAFWASTEPTELSISTADLETAEFARWFLAEVGGSCA